jgi:hypothetical protein
MSQPKDPFSVTPPLHDAQPLYSFPADPQQAVSQYAPPSSDLQALVQRVDLPESSESVPSRTRDLRGPLPPGSPDWMRAARTLADALEACIALGRVDPVKHAAIARAWAAWALGGARPEDVLKVAHLVSRAHRAIRETQRAQLDVAYRDCADVLYSGLPSMIRQRMPFERVMLVVRELRYQADAWAAVVEGTSELLGWKDYARTHAASVIRAVIEQSG